ncbi:MAG: hypothetical protein Ct9H90mP30_4240 [Actinomycetota bacterium]|nr:MAG: hypothetical protein Ct9H90mP30_4240 [Actinomycetota bacterium]
MVKTDIAEWLVLNGVPLESTCFSRRPCSRSAHNWTELSELVAGHELLGDEPKKFFDNENIANKKKHMDRKPEENAGTGHCI